MSKKDGIWMHLDIFGLENLNLRRKLTNHWPPFFLIGYCEILIFHGSVWDSQ